MSIPATQMRPGMVIKYKDDLHLVFSVEHRTPGNLRAFIQAKLRNIRTGAMFERFRSPDPIDRVIVDEVKMEYPLQRWRRLLLHGHGELRADAPEARDARRCGRLPPAQPTIAVELPRRQGRRHRASQRSR